MMDKWIECTPKKSRFKLKLSQANIKSCIRKAEILLKNNVNSWFETKVNVSRKVICAHKHQYQVCMCHMVVMPNIQVVFHQKLPPGNRESYYHILEPFCLTS